ncbi:CapA family protein [Myxococcus stipitatus]|uniref:CapA family protein n=1 Tax=Myxococcus stipitatus TaxID=83455 RepID=UPI001F18C69B|nr:CapA family protein [Myxococcus stipitatus]MCE9668458.1 CapA family protein [Myxococcus stipitatus]
MLPSAFLCLALAASPASTSSSAHNFSTARTPDAQRLSSAGAESVRAALRTGDTPAKQLSTAGLASVGAALGSTLASSLSSAATDPIGAALGDASTRASPSSSAATGSVGATLGHASPPSSQSIGAAPGDTSTRASLLSSAATASVASASTVTPTGTPAPQGEATTTVTNAGDAAAQAAIGALRAVGLALSPRLDPVAAEAHYARGLAALQTKDTATAITELTACVRFAPTRVDCRWELGWAHSVQGQWADALTQWTQVQKLDPEHADLESALAQARGQAALQARLSQTPQASNRPPPPADAKVRIRAVGDMMLGTTVPEGNLPPDGGGSVIASVRDLMADADLTFANVEGPLCDNGRTNKCRTSRNCYAFRSPTAYGQFFKDAGVDLASTANNHSGDFGEECRRETEATLDALGIAWSGPPGSIATVERNGLRIGMVAFHTSPSCNHLNNTATATALVRAAALDHDIVIVSFHGGAEGGKALHVPEGREMFFGEDRGDLRAFTHAVVDAGAHVVIGHGPHVVRGLEFYKGRLIAYSLGNFATYGRFNLKGPQGLGMVLEVELDREGAFTAGRVLATKQVGQGIAEPDPSNAVIQLLRDLTTSDFPDSGARISEDGTLHPAGKGPVSARTPTPRS